MCLWDLSLTVNGPLSHSQPPNPIPKGPLKEVKPKYRTPKFVDKKWVFFPRNQLKISLLYLKDSNPNPKLQLPFSNAFKTYIAPQPIAGRENLQRGYAFWQNFLRKDYDSLTPDNLIPGESYRITAYAMEKEGACGSPPKKVSFRKKTSIIVNIQNHNVVDLKEGHTTVLYNETLANWREHAFYMLKK